MLKKILIIKIIAFVLVVAFFFQDILWANPDIGQIRSTSLQVPSVFQEINANARERTLEALFEYFLRVYPNINEFNYRIEPVIRGSRFLLDFNRRYHGADKAIIVPCTITTNNSSRKYEVLIDSENKSVTLRQMETRDGSGANPKPVPGAKPDLPQPVSQAQQLVAPASEVGAGEGGEMSPDVGAGAGMIPLLSYLFNKGVEKGLFTDKTALRLQTGIEQALFWGLSIGLYFGIGIWYLAIVWLVFAGVHSNRFTRFVVTYIVNPLLKRFKFAPVETEEIPMRPPYLRVFGITAINAFPLFALLLIPSHVAVGLSILAIGFVASTLSHHKATIFYQAGFYQVGDLLIDAAVRRGETYRDLMENAKKRKITLRPRKEENKEEGRRKAPDSKEATLTPAERNARMEDLRKQKRSVKDTLQAARMLLDKVITYEECRDLDDMIKDLLYPIEMAKEVERLRQDISRKMQAMGLTREQAILLGGLPRPIFGLIRPILVEASHGSVDVARRMWDAIAKETEDYERGRRDIKFNTQQSATLRKVKKLLEELGVISPKRKPPEAPGLAPWQAPLIEELRNKGYSDIEIASILGKREEALWYSGVLVTLPGMLGALIGSLVGYADIGMAIGIGLGTIFSLTLFRIDHAKKVHYFDENGKLQERSPPTEDDIRTLAKLNKSLRGIYLILPASISIIGLITGYSSPLLLIAGMVTSLYITRYWHGYYNRVTAPKRQAVVGVGGRRAPNYQVIKQLLESLPPAQLEEMTAIFGEEMKGFAAEDIRLIAESWNIKGVKSLAKETGKDRSRGTGRWRLLLLTLRIAKSLRDNERANIEEFDVRLEAPIGKERQEGPGIVSVRADIVISIPEGVKKGRYLVEVSNSISDHADRVISGIFRTREGRKFSQGQRYGAVVEDSREKITGVIIATNRPPDLPVNSILPLDECMRDEAQKARAAGKEKKALGWEIAAAQAGQEIGRHFFVYNLHYSGKVAAPVAKPQGKGETGAPGPVMPGALFGTGWFGSLVTSPLIEEFLRASYYGMAGWIGFVGMSVFLIVFHFLNKSKFIELYKASHNGEEPSRIDIILGVFIMPVIIALGTAALTYWYPKNTFSSTYTGYFALHFYDNLIIKTLSAISPRDLFMPGSIEPDKIGTDTISSMPAQGEGRASASGAADIPMEEGDEDIFGLLDSAISSLERSDDILMERSLELWGVDWEYIGASTNASANMRSVIELIGGVIIDLERNRENVEDAVWKIETIALEGVQSIIEFITDKQIMTGLGHKTYLELAGDDGTLRKTKDYLKDFVSVCRGSEEDPGRASASGAKPERIAPTQTTRNITVPSAGSGIIFPTGLEHLEPLLEAVRKETEEIRKMGEELRASSDDRVSASGGVAPEGPSPKSPTSTKRAEFLQKQTLNKEKRPAEMLKLVKKLINKRPDGAVFVTAAMVYENFPRFFRKAINRSTAEKDMRTLEKINLLASYKTKEQKGVGKGGIRAFVLTEAGLGISGLRIQEIADQIGRLRTDTILGTAKKRKSMAGKIDKKGKHKPQRRKMPSREELLARFEHLKKDPEAILTETALLVRERRYNDLALLGRYYSIIEADMPEDLSAKFSELTDEAFTGMNEMEERIAYLGLLIREKWPKAEDLDESLENEVEAVVYNDILAVMTTIAENNKSLSPEAGDKYSNFEVAIHRLEFLSYRNPKKLKETIKAVLDGIEDLMLRIKFIRKFAKSDNGAGKRILERLGIEVPSNIAFFPAAPGAPGDVPEGATTAAPESAKPEVSPTAPVDAVEDESGSRTSASGEDVRVEASKDILRDFRDPKLLTQNLIEVVISILFSGKKLVLAFHKNIQGFESNKLKVLIRQLAELNEKKEFAGLLKNLVIIQSFTTTEELSSALTERGIDVKDREASPIFVFAPTSQRDGLANMAPEINRVFIDEGKNFNSLIYYYPLFEIVTIALVKYHKAYTEDEMRSLIDHLNIRPDDVNIQAIKEEEGAFLVFALIPKAERLNPGQRMERYALIHKFIDIAA